MTFACCFLCAEELQEPYAPCAFHPRALAHVQCLQQWQSTECPFCAEEDAEEAEAADTNPRN